MDFKPGRFDVTEAVSYVCGLFPGWHIPKVWLEELYDSIKGITEKNFEEQVNALGDRVKHMYLNRYVKYYHGTRLDQDMFYGGADDFIRLVSWSQSFQRGVLIDFEGDRIHY